MRGRMSLKVMDMTRLFLMATVGLLMAGHPAQTQDNGELGKRVGKIDKKFYKALAELSVFYEKKNDPEAAHFFSECFVGFQGAQVNTKVGAIRAGAEIDVYMGKVRGGTVLKSTRKISGAMKSLGRDYKKIVNELVGKGVKRGLSKEDRAVLTDCVVKASLGLWAHEYVPATQRINELRRGMKLRAVLWDFEKSKRVILGCWYMAETGYLIEDKPDAQHGTAVSESTRKFFWNDHVNYTRNNCGRGPGYMRTWPDEMRALALNRQPLMNPDARRVWLGHWQGTYYSDEFPISAYAIPGDGEYRKDIPTPTKHYAGTTTTKGWVDTEETFTVKERKVVLVRYPYKDEPDAPYAFANGVGGEGGWKENTDGWPDQKANAKKYGPATIEKRGVPITLRFFADLTLKDVDAKLIGPGEKKVPCYLYLNGDERVALWDYPTVLVLPKDPLKPRKTYTVTIKCTVSGVAFEKRWSFKTKGK